MNRQQWTLLSGVGLGAGLMYLLDPAAGRHRRAQVRDKATHAFTTGSGAFLQTSKHVGNRAKGLAAGVGSRLRHQDVADEVIVARVRSKMGRHVTYPSQISVVAEDGRVTLSGPVRAGEAARLLGAVQAVKGVREVDDRLEIVGGAEDPEDLRADASRWSRLRDSRLGSGAAALKRPPVLGAAVGTVAVGLLARSLMRRRSGLDGGEAIPVTVVEVVSVEEVAITPLDEVTSPAF